LKLQKTFSLIIVTVLSAAALAACNGAQPGSVPPPPPVTAPTHPDATPSEAEDSATTTVPSETALKGARVRVGTLRGPSGMGLAPLMLWADNGETANTYHFTLGGSPEEMTAGLISGELDIASVPTNVAALLYNRLEGGIRVLNVGTLGGLFIMDRTGEIDTVEDLRGQTIHITGQGALPQFAFEYVLRQNGIEPGVDIEIIFNVEHTELATLMAVGEVDIGMLPQPFVTTVQQRSDDVQIAFGLTEAWEEANPGTKFVQGVVVVRTEFAKAHPDAVKLFLQDHKDSVFYVNTHSPSAAVLMELFDILPAAIANLAIPHSNLVHFEGSEMIPLIESVLAVLYEANPQSVGGAMPGEEFYFLGPSS